MEPSASTSYRQPNCRASSSSSTAYPWPENELERFQDEVIERCESSDKMVNINLSGIPLDCQKKAKSQLLGHCYVKMCDLALCDIVNNRADTVQCKAIKRQRDDSVSRNDEIFETLNLKTARISSTGQHKQSKKKNEVREPSSYKVKNVSDLRLIVKKRPWEFPSILPPCTPIRPGLEYEETDTEPLPGPSRNHPKVYVTSSAPSVNIPRKSLSIPRKALAINTEKRPELNSKIQIDATKRRMNSGSQIEPLPQIEILERRNEILERENGILERQNEILERRNDILERQQEILERRNKDLELIIASNRSFKTPSPLLLKNQDDAGSALSTPPNSDSGSYTCRVDKKFEMDLERSKQNLTPAKSPQLILDRMSASDLRQYGYNRHPSVSPTEETRPKKKPRFSSHSDSEQRSTKKRENKINSTNKVSELFGNDSDEDVAVHPKNKLERSQPLNMDELNYDDYDADEVDESQLSTSEKRKKSKEKSHRDKSSKKGKNSEKDRQKEKDRKKMDDDSKKKRPKEFNKSDKDQVAKGKIKFTIPKLTPNSSAATEPVLNITKAFDELRPTTSRVQQTISSRTPEPVLPDNLIAQTTDLPNVPLTSTNATEHPVAREQNTLSGKAAPTILCAPGVFKGRNTKSVNFHQQLEAIRTISPLHEPGQDIGASSVREKYIPFIIKDLFYQPGSSPREPVKGIRPFHPPQRRIEDEKLNALKVKGARRSYADSSSSSSEEETSETESCDDPNTKQISERTTSEITSTEFCLAGENHAIIDRSSIIPEELSCNPTAQESVQRTMYSTNLDTFHSSTSVVETVTRISVAATSESTRDEGSDQVVTEEPSQVATLKKIPSMAVPPSPRRQTPGPVSQVSSALENAISSIAMEEDSEEDDVLDLGLNDEETFPYEEEEQPPSKLPSENTSSTTTKIIINQPSPLKIARPFEKMNVSTVPVKPPTINRNGINNVRNPAQGDVACNRGLCTDYFKFGRCKGSGASNTKCDLNHKVDSFVAQIKNWCDRRLFKQAFRMICCMADIKSPVNQYLNEPLGLSIIEFVLKAIVANHQDIDIALEILCDRKLPLIRDEVVNGVVRQTPCTPLYVNSLLNLYRRCKNGESHMILSLNSLKKITSVLLSSEDKDWDSIFNVVETTASCYPQSYQPTNDVLSFLFCGAHDQSKLERVCRLFNGFNPRDLLGQLTQEIRGEILKKLKIFDLALWYDIYAGLRDPKEGDLAVSSNFDRTTKSLPVAPQPPNGIVNHPHRGQIPLVPRQQLSFPAVHQMQLPINQPNYQFPPPINHPNYQLQHLPLHPLAPQRPLHLSANLHPPLLPISSVGFRPQFSAVATYRSQNPNIPSGHPVVNITPKTTPVTHSTRDPRENFTSRMPQKNGIDPGPSTPNPVPPTKIVLPVETKKAVAVLEVPKPLHSLDLNLFEPESPEVEPVFLDESEEEQGPVLVANVVVVEPYHPLQDGLETFFNQQKFKDATEWYLRNYTGNRNCPMLNRLMQIIKTKPIYDRNNQRMTIVDIVFKMIVSVFEDEQNPEEPRKIEPRQRQALYDLIFIVLFHFFQKSRTDNTDEKLAHQYSAKNLLDLLSVSFESLLPLNDVIKHPRLLLFAAECLLNIDFTCQDEEFLSVTLSQVDRALTFLIEFHKCVKNTSASIDSNLVKEESNLSALLFLAVIPELDNRYPHSDYANALDGALEDYTNAKLLNKSLFDAMQSSSGE